MKKTWLWMLTFSKYYLKPISQKQPSAVHLFLLHRYFCSLVLAKSFIDFNLLHNDFETNKSEWLVCIFIMQMFWEMSQDLTSKCSWMIWVALEIMRAIRKDSSLCPRWADFAAVEVRFRIAMLIFYGYLLLCAMCG